MHALFPMSLELASHSLLMGRRMGFLLHHSFSFDRVVGSLIGLGDFQKKCGIIV